MNKKWILMIGPDMAGLGGISRVVRIWLEAGFFAGYQFDYLATVSDASKSKLLFSLGSLCKSLRKFIGFPDIVYIHSSGFRSFFRKSLFILLAKLFRRRIILHIHPTWFREFITSLSFPARFYCTTVMKQAQSFIVLTEEMRTFLIEMFPETPIFVLRNAVNVMSMTNKENIQRQLSSLVYLGWFIKAKGVYDLVDAIEILKNSGIPVNLDFFGTKEVSRLRTYVRDKGLDTEISVHDWIGEEEKIVRLYASTMLILPSHSEGIPNVILEAMATRTPILSTFVGGLREVLRDGDNAVLFKEKNPTDLSEKIVKLLNDKELREHISENAYREAKLKYDVEIIKRQFRNILGEVIQIDYP